MSIYYPPTANFIQKTLNAQLLAGVTASATLNNVTSIQNKVGVMIIDRVDANNVSTPNTVEVISFTGTSGSTVTGLARGLAGTTDQDHEVGAIVEFGPDITWAQGLIDSFLIEHNEDGTHASTIVKTTGAQTISGAKTFSVAPLLTFGTEAAGDTYYGAADGTLTRLAKGSDTQVLTLASGVPSWATPSTGATAATQAEVATGTSNTLMVTPLGVSRWHMPPQGFLYNGKIVPSVTSSDLTVALKGLDGNDASASNPIYVRIGDTVRTITAALSVTKNDGTNWFNAGSAELATKEIDYFVYLGYNATDGVVIGFSRYPGASQYGDFSTTSTNEKYCAISTITTAAAGDYYEVIGRFAATLSAGAGYTWTVPTFTADNLKQRPTRTTRNIVLAMVSTGVTAEFSATVTYMINESLLTVNYFIVSDQTSNATTKTVKLPFSSLKDVTVAAIGGGKDNNTEVTSAIVYGTLAAGSNSMSMYKGFNSIAWTASGACTFRIGTFSYLI